MNELEFLKRFGERLTADEDPSIDVRAQVLGRISRQRPLVTDLRVSLCLVGACVLSMIAVLVARPLDSSYDALSLLSDSARQSTGPEAVFTVLEP